jgi:hypothetical protein
MLSDMLAPAHLMSVLPLESVIVSVTSSRIQNSFRIGAICGVCHVLERFAASPQDVDVCSVSRGGRKSSVLQVRMR